MQRVRTRRETVIGKGVTKADTHLCREAGRTLLRKDWVGSGGGGDVGKGLGALVGLLLDLHARPLPGPRECGTEWPLAPRTPPVSTPDSIINASVSKFITQLYV